MNKSKSTFLQRIIIFVILIYILPLFIASVYGLAENIYDDKSGEYIKITNLAFAVFAGIATLMFNWASSLDDKIFKIEISVIIKIAEYSIIGGIGYLLASLMQFIRTIPHSKGILGLLPSFYFDTIPLAVIFIVSFLAALSVLIITYIFWMYMRIRLKKEVQ
ncbi:hypothetical protein ACFOG5_05900 [Pedobacter fastidiosus]|uniref:DUF2975 domain-containing protein n=1 Tax=Pedobacter fastidiosus TaxID=2765361 RepID=A0ABR7KQG4_9SPHI|nr:hypothetical protein [Pedobacter fastidiosus]MBC6110325.1 hypothetical protein [Pedobacter fastidiosus]